MSRARVSDERCSVCACRLDAFHSGTATADGMLICTRCTGDPHYARRRIAGLFGVIKPRPNPDCPVDYTDPEVVALARLSPRDIVSMHNTGEGADRLALLFEIADEEGWS